MEEKRGIGPVTISSTTGATLGLALSFIIIWVLKVNGVDVPEGLEGAINSVLTIGATMIGGWLVKPGAGKRRA